MVLNPWNTIEMLQTEQKTTNYSMDTQNIYEHIIKKYHQTDLEWTLILVVRVSPI